MKALLVLLLACSFVHPLHAQVKRSGNTGLDSLKQGVKNLGMLFKKASIIKVDIANIKSDDPKLVALVKSIREVAGVTRLKAFEKSPNVLLEVAYKGEPEKFWALVPPAAKKYFTTLQLSDSSVMLSYTDATVKPAVVPPVSNTGNNETHTNVKPTIVSNNANTDNASLTKGAALLFGNVKSSLSNNSKNAIFKLFNVGVTKNGKQFTQEGGEEYPFGAQVYPVDLNKDGKEEIFILFGNSYTSGAAGTSIAAFFPDKNGGFEIQLGFPGTLPDVLATSSLGYPDRLIGGPGFEFPVHRWNGKIYDFYRQVNDKDYEKLKKTNLEDVSKAYCATTK